MLCTGDNSQGALAVATPQDWRRVERCFVWGLLSWGVPFSTVAIVSMTGGHQALSTQFAFQNNDKFLNWKSVNTLLAAD